jgi:hypothetical protein
LLDAGPVRDVHAHESEAGLALQPGQARLLEADVVVVVQVVQSHHLVTARQQLQRRGHADEAGSPCH